MTDTSWSSRAEFDARTSNGRDKPIDPFDLRKSNTASWHGLDVTAPLFVWGSYAARGEVTVLVSQGGGGKTTLMQQLVSVAAHGINSFIGLAVAAGAGYLMATEDNERSARYRQRKIDEWLNNGSRSQYELHVAHMAEADVFLWNDDGPTVLAGEFETTLVQIPALSIIVIDSASTVFGGNENSRMQVTRFLRWLNGLASRLNAAIILICHSSKSADGSPERSTSGSTAWINSARSVVMLKPQSTEDSPSIQLVKSNLAIAPGPKIDLIWNDAAGLLERQTDPDWIEKRSKDHELTEIILALVVAGYEPGIPYLKGNQGGKKRCIVEAVLNRHSGAKRREVEAAIHAMLCSTPPRIFDRKRTKKTPSGLCASDRVENDFYNHE